MLTSEIKDIAQADVFIVTVPTPIDKFNKPDLSILKAASKTIGKAIKLRSSYDSYDAINSSVPIIIYESTVFPGATEEVCIQ